ncbi:hypothetical protein O1L44_13330 [Streptomyces noursei]|uniref:hypothetical protein n=1 Tax=Streptomyces noursei TaxID=1971 RepID=UPI000B28296E|nr:hypothetical protein [Streptomyces noursei]
MDLAGGEGVVAGRGDVVVDGPRAGGRGEPVDVVAEAGGVAVGVGGVQPGGEGVGEQLAVVVVEGGQQVVEGVGAGGVEGWPGGAARVVEGGRGVVAAVQQAAEEALAGGHGVFGDPVLGGGEDGGAQAVGRQGEIGRYFG